eukprot:TRINITY_DN29485_c0_g1_i1.p1 TRINITY_DN29485_c0_g1~~TRINITY_DN29485_c0_g1_i1.p1  ORF type:complete len:238 (+),score=22.41 TRINITY_DN29485_c0_g1_i1:198-911(+)
MFEKISMGTLRRPMVFTQLNPGNFPIFSQGDEKSRLGTAASFAPLTGSEGRSVGNMSIVNKAEKHPETIKSPAERKLAKRSLLFLVGIASGTSIRMRDVNQSVALAGEDVCGQCYGSGKVPCGLCEGTGRWLTGTQNGIQVRDTCPQCEGAGQLKCARCLGTGLKNTAGLLRGPAVTEGRLRVREDGSLQILDCDYFPATRGKDCTSALDFETSLLTEERAQSASRGKLYPRPDFVE